MWMILWQWRAADSRHMEREKSFRRRAVVDEDPFSEDADLQVTGKNL
jgi:hypothetical protein